MKCKKCKSDNINKSTIDEDNYGEGIGIKYTCLECGNQYILCFDNPNAKEALKNYFI